MDDFAFAAPRVPESTPEPSRPAPRLHSDAMLLGLILLGCCCADLLAPGDPGWMDLDRCGLPPGPGCWFGTDAMGRDLFSMIWHGGRVSLLIGFGAAALSTGLGVLIGGFCGLAPRWLEALLNRLTEILLSVPSLLLTVMLQAALGDPSPWSLAFVIGVTGWTGTAKVAAGEVRRIRGCAFVAASRVMGGGFFHILRRHLAPNCTAAVLPMAVMSFSGAVASEAALSFMGMGLPVESVSWGSILSLSGQALLTGQWWLLLIPGGFLIAALLCTASLGNRLRGRDGRRHSYL